MRKILITESQLRLIVEGMSKVLYHFTSIENAYSICSSDKICLQSSYAKDSDNFDNKRKFYLSCTRIRDSRFGYSNTFNRYGGARIELDGDALSTKYKGRQVNYWGGGVFTDKYKYTKDVEDDASNPEDRKAYRYDFRNWMEEHPDATEDEKRNWIMHNFYDDAQRHTSNESEDRVFSYDSYIPEANRYIKHVDILIPGFTEERDKMALAQAFRFRTFLGRANLVRIFDSESEFNNPNGKDANDKVEYGNGMAPIRNGGYARANYAPLESVICFIAYANKEFEGKNFPRKTMEYLNRYELSEFSTRIGDLARKFNEAWGFNSIVDRLDANRRALSDKPNEYTRKISQMLTDYFKSIGANSFREAIMIKKNIANEYYGLNKVTDRIDTLAKYTFLIINEGIIVLNPDRDKFSDAMRWNDDHCRIEADSLADEIMYHPENYTFSSKNYNSMFQFLYKLLRKGSVRHVLDTLKTLGFTDEYINDNLANFSYKELNYWDATGYTTPASNNMMSGDYNYRTVSRQNGREIEMYFKGRQEQEKKMTQNNQ